MKVLQKFRGLVDESPVIKALIQMVDDLFRAINSISFGPVVTKNKPENFDGVFLSGTITGVATDNRFFHNLGRVPNGLLELKISLQVNNDGAGAGFISITSWSATDIVLRTTQSPKTFYVLLF